MRFLVRYLQALRSGDKNLRFQAVTGLVLAAGAAAYLIWKAINLILVVGVFLFGAYLMRRSARSGSPRP